jgi:hypothetical protein
MRSWGIHLEGEKLVENGSRRPSASLKELEGQLLGALAVQRSIARGHTIVVRHGVSKCKLLMAGLSVVPMIWIERFIFLFTS